MIEKAVNVSKIQLKSKRTKINLEKQPRIKVTVSEEYAQKCGKFSHSIVVNSSSENFCDSNSGNEVDL